MSAITKEFDRTKTTHFQSLNHSTIQATPNKQLNPQQMSYNTIQNDPRYAKLYEKFLCNNKRIASTLNQFNEDREQKKIKKIISNSLDMKRKATAFQEKFNSQCKIKKKSMSTIVNPLLTTITQKIGQTQLQTDTNNRQLFFSQNRKVLQLQQECMLLQYYYKDKAKYQVQKNNITVNTSYLKNRNTSESKHRRLSNNKQYLNKLYLTSDENKLKKEKKLNFVKTQKFKHQTYKKAERNYTYKRSKNFHQMQEVIRDYHQNLLLESNRSTKDIQAKQKLFNMHMRLFLKFSTVCEVKRVYNQYIDEQGIQKLKAFTIHNSFIPGLKRSVISQFIQNIVENKIEKRLEFYDFIQFCERIDETYNVKFIQIVQRKFPDYFQSQIQNLKNQNFDQINKEATQKKTKFILKLMFESSDQLALKKYLPVRAIPKLFLNFELTQNDVLTSKVIWTYLWNLNRPEGLNFLQFFHGSVMLGMDGKGRWDKFTKLFKKEKKQLAS